MTASATDWKHYYFLGISSHPLSELNLTQAHISSLFSMVEVKAGIATNLAIDPRLLINAKGTTVWLAMFALMAVQYPQDLEAAKNNETLLLVPGSFLNESFKHNNWPAELLAEVDLDLPGYHMFVLPFLISNQAPLPKSMQQSIRAPDGSLEILGIQEFVESQPQVLLKNCESIIDWYRRERIKGS